MKSRLTTLVTLVSFIAFFAACGPSGPSSPPSIVSFTASATTLYGGGNVTLSWVQANATSLSINNGVGSVSNETQTTVNVTATATYTLTASNSLGTATKSVTVTVDPACEGTIPTLTPFATLGIATPSVVQNVVAADDHVGLAIPYLNSNSEYATLVWNGSSWSSQTLGASFIFTPGLTMGSVAGKFYGFISGVTSIFPSATTAADAYSEQAGGSFTGTNESGMASDTFRLVSGNAATGTLAVVYENTSSQIALYEGSAANLASLGGGAINVGGSAVTATPLAFSYATDGTAWMVYYAVNGPDTEVTVVHRVGSAWTMAGGSNLGAGVSNLVVVPSPAGDHFLILWSQVDSSFYNVNFYVFDPNLGWDGPNLLGFALGTPAEIAAAFSQDGSNATVAYSNGAGQAWTATITGNTNVSAGPTSFHPELDVSEGSLQPFYNDCDSPMIVYRANPNGTNNPAPVTIQAL